MRTLYAFKGGDDAAAPWRQGLVYVGGNLYGATSFGRVNNGGAAFSVNAKTGAETVLARLIGGGENRINRVIYVGGNLFGTSSLVPTSLSCDGLGGGSIFKINPKAPAENIIYAFKCAPDGAQPEGGLVYEGGILYGKTFSGGTSSNGTVFGFDLKTSREKIIYSFGGSPHDAGGPENSIVGHDGILYGVAYGGTLGADAVFAVNVPKGTEVVLYSFHNGIDGGQPVGGLIYESGYLYGTTYTGGLTNCYGSACGFVYKVNAVTGVETVLHSFQGGTDGASPYSGLIYYAGLLYGTMDQGGAYGFGTIFSVDPKSGNEKILHNFTGGSDGAEPYAALTYAGRTLYDTTAYGGSLGYGMVFSFVP